MYAPVAASTDATTTHYAFMTALSSEPCVRPATAVSILKALSARENAFFSHLLGHYGATIILRGKIAPSIEIRHELVITIERDDLNQLVAYEPRTDVFGVGSTPREALADLVSMLLDLVHELTNSEDILSSHLRQRLDFLRSILVMG